jgi:hypothetical protein
MSLMGVHVMSVYVMGVNLISVHLIGVYLMGAYLMGAWGRRSVGLSSGFRGSSRAPKDAMGATISKVGGAMTSKWGVR